MNFGMLKNMVENLVSSYKCPFCENSTISEQNIDIVGAAGNTVNIDMHCPSCDKHFMAKTEIVQVELGNMNSDSIAKIQESLLALKGKLGGEINVDAQMLTEGTVIEQEDSIKDAEIMDLNSKLNDKDITVEDIFSENDTEGKS